MFGRKFMTEARVLKTSKYFEWIIKQYYWIQLLLIITLAVLSFYILSLGWGSVLIYNSDGEVKMRPLMPQKNLLGWNQAQVSNSSEFPCRRNILFFAAWKIIFNINLNMVHKNEKMGYAFCQTPQSLVWCGCKISYHPQKSLYCKFQTIIWPDTSLLPLYLSNSIWIPSLQNNI